MRTMPYDQFEKSKKKAKTARRHEQRKSKADFGAKAIAHRRDVEGTKGIKVRKA